MLDLDELERLEREATAAPWYSHIEIQDGRSEYDPSLEWLEISPHEDAGADGFMFSEASDAVSEGQVSNFDLTCALRNNASALIARARRADELEAATRWIPVSERLPTELEHVLSTTSRGDVEIGYYCNRGWYSDEDVWWDGPYFVTHWMPCPEPPA